MKSSQLRNLMFDLGGVIMDIRKERCVQAFQELGLPDANSYFGDFSQEGIFAAIESGKIGVEEFHARLHELIPHAVSDADIDHAFMQFLIGIPRHRLEALRALREHYGIYLLSNTNPIMWNSFISEQFRQEGMELCDYFDGVVTSFEAKCLKPGAAIFEYAQKKFGISPVETMFLDDSQANCEAAQALGWHAMQVPAGTEFMQLLQEKGLA